MFRAPSGEGVDIDDRRPSTTPARTACTAPPTALLFPVDMGKDTQRTEKEPRWCCSACPPARPSLIMRWQKGGGLRNNPIPTVRTPLSRVHVRIVVKVLIKIFFRLRFCAASAIAVPAASPQLHTSQAAPPWGARFHLSQTPRLRHRDYRKQYCPLQSYINLKQRSIPP
jgi:hypothetical protein